MSFIPCKICGNTTSGFLPQFELLKCNTCGFIFFKNPLSETYVKELYDKLYNQQEDYAAYKMQADQLMQGKQAPIGYDKTVVLNKLLEKGCSNFAEIGAGVGIVGKYLESKQLKYEGIELDHQAATLAAKAGVNVKNGSFQQLESIKNKDCIVAFEVIEHIEDLKECLQMINHSLKSNGYFGFTVPNFQKYYNQSKEKQKTRLDQVGPPVHINFFTIENISEILPLFGFKIVYLKVRPFPSLNFNRKITYIRLLKSLIGKYHGPNILCIAKKIKEAV
ncbi:MAG: type 11 methyltransferase [Segetibacter sp.]|jgi:2-polyprenyl-3-methyl-5-hydroxy-6-metoxy-1,4-benzoquinol methylase|nr:type 11 methyltransferase [Segetibacter sp.]